MFMILKLTINFSIIIDQVHFVLQATTIKTNLNYIYNVECKNENNPFGWKNISTSVVKLIKKKKIKII